METQAKNVNRVDPGKLDPKFGDSGQIRPHDQSGGVMAVALSAEGVLTYAVREGQGFNVYRTDPDGILDPSFGGGSGNTGEWQFIPGEGARPTRLLLQKDGKVLVIGNSIEVTALKPAALTRFNVNGSPDLVFGSFVIPIPHRDWAFVDSIDGCLQADGKILIAFSYATTDSGGSVLVRLHSDGKLDTSFNDVGFVEVERKGHIILLSSVVIQDGKIIVGGTTASNQLILASYDLEGRLNTGFGTGGFTFYAALDGSELKMRQLIAQDDGKLVCAGNGMGAGMVMRFTELGHVDKTWNRGLPVLTHAGPGTAWNSLAKQLDDKIVVAGTSENGTEMIAGRLLPDGTYDAGFSEKGWIVVGSSGGVAMDVKIQGSARIIVGGEVIIRGEGRKPVVYGLQA